MRSTVMMGLGLALLFGLATETAAQDRARLLRERQAIQEVAMGLERIRVEIGQATARTAARQRIASQRAAEVVALQGALARRARSGATTVPESWLPQDPADSLYREARSRLNGRRYLESARLFAEIRSAYPRSGYVGDAYYFEALARSRAGAQAELRRAMELLVQQERSHPSAATRSEARALRVRIESQLASRGDASAAEALMGAARGNPRGAQVCDDEQQSLRATALSALLQMNPERARPILQEVLRARDECSAELREQAIFILAQSLGDGPDDGTLDLLVDLAHRNPDPDPQVRQAAVFWLSQSGSDEAIDALVSILESGTATPEIAEQAVFALGQSRNARALQVLRDFALDAGADPELRANAVFFLGQQGGEEAGPFLRSLYESLDDPELKERVLVSIAQNPGEGTLSWLMERALDSNESMEVRTIALFWAGEAGLTAQQALEVYRTAQAPELREQAIFVLTQVAADTESVDALMEIARSEKDPELRERAVFWLGQSDDPRVADFLLEIIRGGGGR